MLELLELLPGRFRSPCRYPASNRHPRMVPIMGLLAPLPGLARFQVLRKAA